MRSSAASHGYMFLLLDILSVITSQLEDGKALITHLAVVPVLSIA